LIDWVIAVGTKLRHRHRAKPFPPHTIQTLFIKYCV